MANIVYIKIALIIFLTISILCLIATHAERLRELTLRLFNILYSPFFGISTWCRQAYTAIIDWVKKQISIESEQNDSQHAIYYFAGCILYGCFTALFIYCDLGLIIQSIEAIGFTSTLQIVEPATVMAISMIASSIAWGVIFFDAIGITHLAPCFGKLSNIGKIVLSGFSTIFFVISLMCLISLSYLRAGAIVTSMIPDANAYSTEILTNSNIDETDNIKMLTDQLNESQNDTDSADLPAGWIIYTAMVLTGLSVIVCTMVCFTACIPLIKWLVLCVCMILMVPMFAVWAVSALIALIVDALSGFARNFLDLLVDIGNSILNRFRRKQSTTPNNLRNRSEDSSTSRSNEAKNGKKSSKNATPDADDINTEDTIEDRDTNMGFDPFG